MTLIFIKLILGLLMATAIIKITGKTTLAPQAPIDQIQNYILGGIIGGTIYSNSISVIDFIKVMAAWAVISISFYYVRKKSKKVSAWLDGKTIRVIESGKLSEEKLHEAGLSTIEIYTMLRTQSISSITDVEVGTIEKNGSLSVIPKNAVEKTFVVIIDGHFNDGELSRADLSEDNIKNLLHKKNINDISSINLLEIDENKMINYVQTKM
ncbi:DUF421 domain-containing protein [Leuconostoc citreum]